MHHSRHIAGDAKYAPRVVNPDVAVDEFLRSLHWNVHGLERQVSKEGLAVLDIAVDELDGLIHQEARRVEIFRELVFLAVGVPVGLVILFGSIRIGSLERIRNES